MDLLVIRADQSIVISLYICFSGLQNGARFIRNDSSFVSSRLQSLTKVAVLPVIRSGFYEDRQKFTLCRSECPTQFFSRYQEISYPGEFVPRRIRTQNEWVRILWLIRTWVRIIQRIRTLHIISIILCVNLYPSLIRC